MSEVFEAVVVVGSGAAGVWAAKELPSEACPAGIRAPGF
jgi:hypothetical protein